MVCKICIFDKNQKVYTCDVCFKFESGILNCRCSDFNRVCTCEREEDLNPMEEKKGVKYDQGKSAVELIPYAAEKAIGDVLEMGRSKYGEANWAKGIEYSRLIAATKRHIGKFNSGIDLDEESGLSHVAHAAANLVFLLWMIENRPDMDNRWEKGVKK